MTNGEGLRIWSLNRSQGDFAKSSNPGTTLPPNPPRNSAADYRRSNVLAQSVFKHRSPRE